MGFLKLRLDENRDSRLVVLAIALATFLVVSADFFEDWLVEQTIDLAFVQTIITAGQILAVSIGISKGFELAAGTYDEVRALPDFVLKKFYKKVWEKARLNPNSIVLDAGIGSGRTAGPLLDWGVHVVGIDISPRMLSKAANKVRKASAGNRVDLIRGDITHFPFRPHSFDMIISIHVLWLVQKWKTALNEITKALKPKGFFVAAEHSSPEFVINEIGAKCWELERKAYGYKGVLENKHVSQISFVHRLLVPQVKRLLLRVLQILRKDLDWKTYLAKKSRFQENFSIERKTTLAVRSAVCILQRRVSSLEQNLPAETIQEFRENLAKWSNKELQKNAPLEIKETFTFTMVQF